MTPCRVKGADDRSGVQGESGERRARRQRLVEMPHIESLIANRSDCAQSCRGVGSERRDGTVRGGGQAVSEGRHVGPGRRPITGAEHTNLVSSTPHLLREAEYLRLDTTGHREAVGTEHPHPHHATHPGSLGQFG